MGEPQCRDLTYLFGYHFKRRHSVHFCAALISKLKLILLSAAGEVIEFAAVRMVLPTQASSITYYLS